jgi:hypothetical protein
MEDFFTFNNLVLLGTYIITGSAVYWRMRMDIEQMKIKNKIELAAINLKIEEMKDDRNRKWDEQKEKWICHDEKQGKNDDKYDALLALMNEVKLQVERVNTTISFLKEK